MITHQKYQLLTDDLRRRQLRPPQRPTERDPYRPDDQQRKQTSPTQRPTAAQITRACYR